jgi:hypothetical protein
MDSALLYAYMLDIGWFLLLTVALTLVATTLIIFMSESWESKNYEPEKQAKS